jgi:hypothetical protein
MRRMAPAPRAKLRIHSDRSYLPDGVPHAAILEPFWGPAGRDADTRASFRRWRETGASVLELTSLEEADVAVLPYDWTYATWENADFYPESRDNALRFAEAAARAGKPVAVFYETDMKLDIPFEHVLFCTDLDASDRAPHEFALPGWSEDLLAKYRGGKVAVREKGSRPTVGFCGYAPPLGMPLGKAKAKEAVRYVLGRTRVLRFWPAGPEPSLRIRALRQPGPAVRVRALRALARSEDVETNFLIRSEKTNARGGRWKRPPVGVDVEPDSQVEYLENTLESDYVLCSRGFGNFSYRLYETLASGRIPVLVDTACVLPLDFAIDWDRYCVRVPEAEVRHIGARVAEFHAGLTPEGFRDLEIACRRLWEERLSPEGFFANLYRHFDRIVGERIR